MADVKYLVKRLSTEARQAYEGELGELVLDTDEGALYWLDGKEAGGYPVSTDDGVKILSDDGKTISYDYLPDVFKIIGSKDDLPNLDDVKAGSTEANTLYVTQDTGQVYYYDPEKYHRAPEGITDIISSQGNWIAVGAQGLIGQPNGVASLDKKGKLKSEEYDFATEEEVKAGTESTKPVTSQGVHQAIQAFLTSHGVTFNDDGTMVLDGGDGAKGDSSSDE